MTDYSAKMSVSQILKQPVTYALIVIVSMFWGVLTWVTNRSDRSDDRCWEEVVTQRRQLESLRKENTELYKSLLVSNGIIKQITSPDTTNKLDTQ